MSQHQRQRPRSTPALVDRVHRDPIKIDADLIEAVERPFLHTPVGLSLPVRHQTPQVRRLGVVAPLSPLKVTGRPAATRQAFVEVYQSSLGDRDAEGLHGVNAHTPADAASTSLPAVNAGLRRMVPAQPPPHPLTERLAEPGRVGRPARAPRSSKLDRHDRALSAKGRTTIVRGVTRHSGFLGTGGWVPTQPPSQVQRAR
jgi:hypothetical protein